MCGIAGFCNWKTDWEKNIRKMNDRMRHRGPDASGIWASEDGSVVFGHQRLSIVDLSENGAQPMQSHSGRFEIAFNGEIYNYKQIAKRLLDEKKGGSFPGRFGYGGASGGYGALWGEGSHFHVQGDVCHRFV